MQADRREGVHQDAPAPGPAHRAGGDRRPAGEPPEQVLRAERHPRRVVRPVELHQEGGHPLPPRGRPPEVRPHEQDAEESAERTAGLKDPPPTPPVREGRWGGKECPSGQNRRQTECHQTCLNGRGAKEEGQRPNFTKSKTKLNKN